MPVWCAVGFDVSMNHGAAVVLDDEAQVVDIAFYSALAKDVAKGKPYGERVPSEITSLADHDARNCARLRWVTSWFRDFRSTLATYGDVYVAVEDYAYKAIGMSYQIGEIGGALRTALTEYRDDSRVYLRLHDPMTLKMFATGNGAAPKVDVQSVVAAKDRGLFAFASKFGTKPRSNELSDSGGDICDAYMLARVAHAEKMIRDGAWTLDKLDEHERKVFLRVTKHRPVNLVARDLIRSETKRD